MEKEKLEKIRAKWRDLPVPGLWRVSHGSDFSEIYGGTEDELIGELIRDKRTADAIADAPADIAALIESVTALIKFVEREF